MANKNDYVVEKCLSSYEYLFKNDLLRGKVAFITGGGSGICFTIAEVFMRHRCDVVIASRNFARLKESADELATTTGAQCLPVQMDVRKPQQIMDAVDAALSKFGKIDFLINGAAGNFISPIAGLSFNAFRTVMDIDANGTFNVCKVVFEKYFQNHGGVIINITATLHYRGTPMQMHAGAAKAAIDAMAKHMAVEWGPCGVRVLNIAPGPVGDTEGMRRLGGGRIPDDYVKTIPLQRIGLRLDIANGALFLVSKAADLWTGFTAIIDGGHWMTHILRGYSGSKL